MPELNPNLILAAGQAPAVPLNDLSQVYLNAQKMRAQQNELDAQDKATQQAQVMSDAYRAATGPDGTVDPMKVQAHLAANGAGGAIPGFQKVQGDYQHVQAQTAEARATADATNQATLSKSLQLIDGSIASLAANPDVNENMVYSEMGRLVSAGAFDVQARHANTTPDQYAKGLLSTMPVGNPPALHGWLVSNGLRAADANERLKALLPQASAQDRGNVINNGTVDPLTGQRTDGPDAVKGQTPDSVAQNATTQRGQDLQRKTAVEQIAAQKAAEGGDLSDDDVAANAKAIANYQQAPMSPYAASKPGGQRIMAQVYSINPDYNEQNYHVSQAAYKNFAQGPLGNKARSFSVGIDHLDTLGQLVDQLNNTSSPAWNKVANAFSTQVGGVVPQSFEAAKQVVAKEVTAAIVAGGGGEHERQAAEATINQASSPQALKAVINTYQHLMVGQLNGMKRQYESGTMRKDFEQAWMSPRARAIRQGMLSGAPDGTPAPSVPGAPAASPPAPGRGQGSRSIDDFFLPGP